MRRAGQFALLWLLLAAPASAQFALSRVNGTVETAAPAALQLGSFRQGEIADVRLRIRNVSLAAAILNPLRIDGIGFVSPDAPAEAVALAPQETVEFSINFQASDVGPFSGFLYSDRISLLLTVTVLPPFVLHFDSASGLFLSETAPASLGSIDRGTRLRRVVVLENRAALPAVVPPVAVSGAGFSVDSPSPAGSTLQSRDTAAVEIAFVSSNTGDFAGSLTLGDRTYAFTVTVREPALPKPVLSFDLPAARSGEQGAVRVRYDAVARTSGTGVLTLAFSGADPSIQFASGGRRLEFPIVPADTETPEFLFQTGTTAGILSFTVDVGGIVDRQTVTIDPAPVTLTAVEAIRSAASLEVRLTGFDNVRTASVLTFTFYDASGASVAPGAIRSDVSASFSAYFAASNLGGIFQIRSVFPVAGDPAHIAAFEAEIVNSAGVVRIPRTKIP